MRWFTGGGPVFPSPRFPRLFALARTIGRGTMRGSRNGCCRDETLQGSQGATRCESPDRLPPSFGKLNELMNMYFGPSIE